MGTVSWVDHLKPYVTQWCGAESNETKHEQILLELYSDNDLCKIFGFNFCADRIDVANLMCFYRHMLKKFGLRGQQQVLGDGRNLGNIMAIFAELSMDSGSEDIYRDCECLVGS